MMLRQRIFALAVLVVHPASGPVHVITQCVVQGLRVRPRDMEQGTCGHQLSPLVMPCRASFHGGESSVARVHLDIKSGEPVRTAEFLRRSSGTALQPYAPTTRLRFIAPTKLWRPDRPARSPALH